MTSHQSPSGQGAVVDFLLRHGLVQTPQQGVLLLGGCVLVCVGIIFYLLTSANTPPEVTNSAEYERQMME